MRVETTACHVSNISLLRIRYFIDAGRACPCIKATTRTTQPEMGLMCRQHLKIVWRDNACDCLYPLNYWVAFENPLGTRILVATSTVFEISKIRTTYFIKRRRPKPQRAILSLKNFLHKQLFTPYRRIKKNCRY